VLYDNDANGTKRTKKQEVVTAAKSGRVFREEDGLVIQNGMLILFPKLEMILLRIQRLFTVL
jgi:hypothetical protein